jgi:hypothetical protein
MVTVLQQAFVLEQLKGSHACKCNSSTQAARHAVTPFPCMQGSSLTQGCARKQADLTHCHAPLTVSACDVRVSWRCVSCAQIETVGSQPHQWAPVDAAYALSERQGWQPLHAVIGCLT